MSYLYFYFYILKICYKFNVIKEFLISLILVSIIIVLKLYNYNLYFLLAFTLFKLINYFTINYIKICNIICNVIILLFVLSTDLRTFNFIKYIINLILIINFILCIFKKFNRSCQYQRRFISTTILTTDMLILTKYYYLYFNKSLIS